MHFIIKHVCTHSLGVFVHNHLKDLMELVHTALVRFFATSMNYVHENILAYINAYIHIFVVYF